jgi:large subunit ribosomal protein L13e
LVVFPKKAGKPKSGDATVRFHLQSSLALTDQQGDNLTAHITRSALPLPASYEAEAPRSITAEEKEFSAFRTLRIARADQRNSGKRAARAAVRAAQEEAAKK